MMMMMMMMMMIIIIIIIIYECLRFHCIYRLRAPYHKSVVLLTASIMI